MVGALGIFKARGTEVFNRWVSRPSDVVGGSLTALMPVKCALHSQIYAPFLLNMALPPTALALSALIMLPTAYIEHRLRRGRVGEEAPTFKGKFNLPRWLAVVKWARAPMTPADTAEWRGDFFPAKRLAGVSTFLLFFLCVGARAAVARARRRAAAALDARLTRRSPPRFRRYPTLVQSVASIFNCTDKIEDVQYLVADLTVVCYEGWHIAFLCFATVGVAVYMVGIPVVLAGVVVLRSPVQRDGEGKMVCARCARRRATEYNTLDVRSRFAFLFNGYATDRSSVVVAWEALVMLRKLAVVLAGSVLRDPYLQILAALLVLVVSFGATAFVQPYETSWLNLLDVLGLFALIATQILSIVYFYTETATYPFMDTDALEGVVTALLFALNAIVLLTLAVCYAIEVLELRAKCAARSRVVLKVATPAVTAGALRAYGVDETIIDPVHLWCHPNQIAVSLPPSKFERRGVWVWYDDKERGVTSRAEPELLLQLAQDETLLPGAAFRTMHKVTRKLSAKMTQLNNDVGGCGSVDAAEHEHNPPAAVVEFVENPERFPAQRVDGDDPFGDGDGGEGALEDGIRMGALAHAAPAVSDHAVGVLVEARNSPAHNRGATHRGVDVEGGVAVGGEDAAAEDDESAPAFEGEGAIAGVRVDAPMDADGAARRDINAHSTGWFYEDAEDASVLHGPFPLTDLQLWSNDGHLDGSLVVRHGREGEDVALSTLIRMAEDGMHYTRAEYIDFFDGTDEWNAAGDAVLVEH
jgi:hypothetical protein